MYRRLIVILFLFYCISTVSADEAVIHFFRDTYASRTIIVRSTGPLYCNGNTIYTTQSSVDIILKTENIKIPNNITGTTGNPSTVTYTLINEHIVTDTSSSYTSYAWSGGRITLNAGLNAGKMYSIKYSYGLKVVVRQYQGERTGGHFEDPVTTVDSDCTGNITLVVVQDIAGAGITIP